MFHFTIRELVLLTLVVSLAVGWWLDHSSLAPGAELHRRLQERTGVAYRVQMKTVEEFWERNEAESGQSVSPDEN